MVIKDTKDSGSIIEHPTEKVYPSYYSVLTAKVRYDKEIPMGAKVCFSEITALCNRSGFCYASNKYFAGLYDVSETTISTWIKRLQERGHITASYMNGMRKMYIPEQTIQAGAFPKTHPKAKGETTEMMEAEAKVQANHANQRKYFNEQQKAYEDDPATPEFIRAELAKAKIMIHKGNGEVKEKA